MAKRISGNHLGSSWDARGTRRRGRWSSFRSYSLASRRRASASTLGGQGSVAHHLKVLRSHALQEPVNANRHVRCRSRSGENVQVGVIIFLLEQQAR